MADIDQSILACSYTLNDQSTTPHSPRCYSLRAHGTPMPLLLTTSATPYFLRASDPSANFFARPSCSIWTFGRNPFADCPRAFFSSGDYSTNLFRRIQHGLPSGDFCHNIHIFSRGFVFVESLQSSPDKVCYGSVLFSVSV